MILYSSKQNGSNSISKGAYYDGDGSKNASAQKINSRCFKAIATVHSQKWPSQNPERI